MRIPRVKAPKENIVRYSFIAIRLVPSSQNSIQRSSPDSLRIRAKASRPPHASYPCRVNLYLLRIQTKELRAAEKALRRAPELSAFDHLDLDWVPQRLKCALSIWRFVSSPLLPERGFELVFPLGAKLYRQRINSLVCGCGRA